MLEIRDLEISYGAIRAVRGVSLEVRPREIVTLVGNNGAGKSFQWGLRTRTRDLDGKTLGLERVSGT
jgi:ABC-type branched-subunit amino acid transport system ATPase component